MQHHETHGHGIVDGSTSQIAGLNALNQAMATAFFLAGAFEDTNIYLSSIAEYMQDDQDFMWNYGISKVRIVWDAPAAPAVCLFMLTSELLL